ncbi:uncharacterized protein LOC124662287 [Lolium rigidum]|uniref:uncharacterized protein LOC124662287 n=1 Tax=Lolium rigidum TaxID=89674 RepID=UPI001F5C24EE|nr:uncharacterized protein LOC124662287 [Lolium rigidum]
MDLLLIIGVADSIVCGARVVIDAGGEGKREYLDTGGRLLAAWRIRRLREKGNSTTLSGPKYLSELMRFMRQQGQFASKITHRNFSKKGVGLLLSRTPVGISIIDAYVDGVGVIESVPNAELKADNHYQGPFDGKQHNLNINKQTGLGYLTNEAGPYAF